MPRQRREIPWLKIRHGTYYVYWYDHTAGRTKRVSTGTTNAVEAQAWYATFLAGGHAILGPDAARGLTVTAGLDDYWREHVALHVIDKVRAQSAIAHLKAWFKNTLFKEIDIPASRAYVDARRMGIIGGGKRRKNGEGADSTIRRELVVLKAAAGHAERWRRLGSTADPPTPMPSIELPKEVVGESLSDDDWLTLDEWRRALAAATGSLRDFMVLTYDSASRKRAIETITTFQVDLAIGRVNLRGPHETVQQRQSKKRRPVVPIGLDARQVYERLMATSTDGRLFPQGFSAYRPFRKLMESIDLGHKRNPHILRHTRATHLLHAGVGVWDVAKLLGDTIATVERVYGHHCPEHLAAAIKGGAE